MKKIRNTVMQWWRLFNTLYRNFRRRMAFVVFLGFVSSFLEGFGVALLVPLIAFLLNGHGVPMGTVGKFISSIPLGSMGGWSFKVMGAVVVVLFLAKGAVLFWAGVFRANTLTNYSRTMRERLYRQMLRSSFSYLRSQKIGSFDHVLISDLKMSATLLQSSTEVVRSAANLCSYAAIAFILSPPIAGVTLLGGALFLAAWNPVFVRLRKYMRRLMRIRSEMAHAISETLIGIKTIKALGVEEPSLERVQMYFNETEDTERKKDLVRLASKLSVEPVALFFIISVFAVSYFYLSFDITTFIPIVYLIQQMFLRVGKIQTSLHVVDDSIAHAEKVAAMIVETDLNKEPRGGTRPFSLEKELSLSHIGFSYRGEPIFSDLSFSVRRGEFVGIIGPTGSGKTTMVDLLLRLMEPSSGRVLLDGVDASQFRIADWRKKIMYVPQESFLLNATVADNVRFLEKHIADTAVTDALARAELGGLVARLPKGVDTPVGERGAELSGGERQRIAIARALARNPAVLIFDEATSALDFETEASVKSVIDGLKGKVTIIVIAHRISTVLGADRVIALENGRIVEEGSPAKLQANPDSYLSRMLSFVT